VTTRVGVGSFEKYENSMPAKRAGHSRATLDFMRESPELPPTQVPGSFFVCLNFRPIARNGVFVSFDAVSLSNRAARTERCTSLTCAGRPRVATARITAGALRRL